MEIVAFADLHNDIKRFEVLLSTRGDIYIGAGDLVSGDRELLIEMFRKVGSKKFYMVPGNNELPEWIPPFFDIHGKRVEIGGISIGGIGGCPVTPFNTLFEWEEDNAYRLLEKIGYVDVLVSHTPPWGSTLSLTKGGKDIGSEAVRWYIDEFNPKLVITGHVHERGGMEERFNRSILVNPGRWGALISLNPGGEVKIAWL